MKRIIVSVESPIVIQNLKYKKGDNSKIRKILLQEQKYFCAYTEEYFGFNDVEDIEHFNPNLKYAKVDSYNNWFLVKHKLNNFKGTKWIEPILHPTDLNFKDRIIYKDGIFYNNPDDIEAKNLIELLDLNNEINVKNRKNYIKRRKESILEEGIDPKSYFIDKINNEISTIKYLRAIQEEFNLDIWSLIPYKTIN
jgi:hypothetical protein